MERERAIDPELRRVLAREIMRQQRRLAKIEEGLEKGMDPLAAAAAYIFHYGYADLGAQRLSEMGMQAMREDEYWQAKGDGKSDG